MPGWLCDLLINIAGVFFGALLAYRASRWHSCQQASERRRVLLSTLESQLDSLPTHEAVSGRGISWPFNIYHAGSIHHLLSGEVMDATVHAALIRQLVQLDNLLMDYGDAARTANLISILHHNHRHDRAQQLLEQLAACRDATLTLVRQHREPWAQQPLVSRFKGLFRRPKALPASTIQAGPDQS
jgi:hypothetical protein